MDDAASLVVVFAKAPQLGRVKTRLAASVGDQQALHWHRRLLERALVTALSARCGPVELHGAPANHTMLRALATKHGVRLRRQAEGDIGRRMHEAFRRGLRHHRRMILIGSDCPVLTAADLRRASRLLRGCDAVIAPAEDGGYPLIGLTRNSVALFAGVDWSTSKVVSQTRTRLAKLGWRWRELRTVWDIDRPEDLRRAKAERVMERRP